MRRIRIAAAGVAAMLLLTPAFVAGQSPPPAPSATARAAGLGTAADALAWLGSQGFSEAESSATADGRSRWVATLPLTGMGGDPSVDVSVELVGSPEALASATFRTTLSAETRAGSLVVGFVQHFAPDGLGFVVDALLRGAFLVEGRARAVDLSDATITVATTRTEATRRGGERMPISITIER
jgi:hypothetical protein